ncbi:helix-turn-helix domain-containing protein [Isoptericola haloaureus]|uniref:helix-turn-helix domain-containing protein n=1 Tax=Isoptericola haloaureus TaxID=1542902 RepID=UPI0038602CFB
MKMADSAIDRLAGTDDGARSLARASLRSRVLGLLHHALDEAGITQTQLASRLGIRKSAIHRTLNGNGNLRVDTIADLLAALGYELHLSACDIGELRQSLREDRAPRCHSWLPENLHEGVGETTVSPPPFTAVYTAHVMSRDGMVDMPVVQHSSHDPRHQDVVPSDEMLIFEDGADPEYWKAPRPDAPSIIRSGSATFRERVSG